MNTYEAPTVSEIKQGDVVLYKQTAYRVKEIHGDQAVIEVSQDDANSYNRATDNGENMILPSQPQTVPVSELEPMPKS